MKNDQRSSSDFTGVFAVGVLVTSLAAIGLLLPARVSPVWGVLNSFAASGDRDPVASAGDTGSGAMGPVLNLPRVMVNLQSGGEDVFLDAAFDLEVATEEDREAVSDRMSRLQEASIDLLSSMKPDDLRGSAGLAKAKGKLLTRFRDLAPQQSLRAIYVNHFVVD
jgi:flagellar basal body-associated protein FliL